jgi:hypothetical protein
MATRDEQAFTEGWAIALTSRKKIVKCDAELPV